MPEQQPTNIQLPGHRRHMQGALVELCSLSGRLHLLDVRVTASPWHNVLCDEI